MQVIKGKMYNFLSKKNKEPKMGQRAENNYKRAKNCYLSGEKFNLDAMENRNHCQIKRKI